ncbi:MAG: iron-sulfur cluster assembly scaffold protein [Deltaproteobacteria bacterium]|nr:iron-sulfur cluster assembly scaffold protein [Deltaproteobacteria bacterium]
MNEEKAVVENADPPGGDTEQDNGVQAPILFYNDVVLEHFTNPCNVGEMLQDEADGFALVGDPTCGDQMKLWIKVESDTITDIKFKSFGCPGAIATSSMATKLAMGKTLEKAVQLTDDDVIRALGGIPEEKKHCSLLGITAIHGAINDYFLRKGTGAGEAK